MPSSWKTMLVGGVAGLAAAAVMTRYQAATASAFGMDKRADDPSTVKAADTVSKAVRGRSVAGPHRHAAGSAVHYVTGAALGIGYALGVRQDARVATGFGLAFGAATALVIDDLLVPAAEWGPWPEAEVPGNLFSMTSHLVFGAVLEGGRRLLAGSAA